MKLHCKHCDKQLTKSLYPTNWKIEDFIEDYYGEGEHKKSYYIPVGAFKHSKNWFGEKCISIHRDSLFLSIPDEKGCCDHDWTPVTCECGVELGISGYDCWQTYHSVDLQPSKVYLKNQEV